jgi:hypothetical protein
MARGCIRHRGITGLADWKLLPLPLKSSQISLGGRDCLELKLHFSIDCPITDTKTHLKGFLECLQIACVIFRAADKRCRTL